jgi:hypothetical protein
MRGPPPDRFADRGPPRAYEGGRDRDRGRDRDFGRERDRSDRDKRPREASPGRWGQALLWAFIVSCSAEEGLHGVVLCMLCMILLVHYACVPTQACIGSNQPEVLAATQHCARLLFDAAV